MANISIHKKRAQGLIEEILQKIFMDKIGRIKWGHLSRTLIKKRSNQCSFLTFYVFTRISISQDIYVGSCSLNDV